MAEKSFEEGYITGWKSIMGQNAMEPGIPGYAVPIGKTEYEHGVSEGEKDARRLAAR